MSDFDPDARQLPSAGSVAVDDVEVGERTLEGVTDELLKENRAAVRRPDGIPLVRATPRQTTLTATVGAHDVDIGILDGRFPGAVERDPASVRRPARVLGPLLVCPPGRARQPPEAGPVRVHREDHLCATVAAGEGQPPAVRRPGQRRVLGDSTHHELAPGSVAIHEVDRIRADVREARGRRSTASGHRQREESGNH